MTSSIAKMLSFKPGTFACGPADCEAWSSGATADGMAIFLFEFDFVESAGRAVFELQFSLTYGLLSITRQGPSATVSKDRAEQVLNMRKKEMELEGVKFTKSQPLELIFVARDIINECGQAITQQDASIFGSWRALCLCIHCHMCKVPDERYGHIGMPTTGMYRPFRDVQQILSNSISTRDIEQLAVQSPYIFMGSDRYGKRVPTLALVKRIAAFMAWWRRQNADTLDQQKADLNASLALTLSMEASAQTTLGLLIDTIRRRRAEMDQGLFSRQKPRLQSWPAGCVQEIVFSSEVASWNPIPTWMKTLNSNPATNSVDTKINAAIRSGPTVNRMDTIKRNSSIMSPRESMLEGHFAQIKMNGPTLDAHNELGGWGWPQFHPTHKGKPRPIEDFAAGISPRARSDRVVAAEEGMVFQPFIRLNQRDFHKCVDNITARRFHQ